MVPAVAPPAWAFDAGHTTDPTVGGRVAEEGAVSTIVLDHEQPNEKSRRRKEKEPVEPVKMKLQRGQHR